MRGKRAIQTTLLLAGFGMLVWACEKDETTFPSRTEQTFEPVHLASIGNSLTAGFQSGGLEMKGQLASFPNLVSQRILGESISLPLVLSPGLGSESGMSPLFVDETGDITREPLTASTTDLLPNATYPLPYANLGVPGSTTRQMLEVLFGDEVGNPFFDAILRNGPRIALGLNGLGSQMRQLELQSPRIITAWTGNNEVLGGALSGSPQSDNPNEDTYVVPVADFEVDFLEFCDRIEALNPEMVVLLNVPPVSAIPFVRFIGTGSVPGVNRWRMDEDNDGDDDNVQLVTLNAPVGDCVGCYLPSCERSSDPCLSLPANTTLTFAEVELIENAIAGYNAIIQREATNRGWAHVDVNSEFLDLPTTANTRPLNTVFPWLIDPISGTGSKNTTSAFSLDGIHPSEKGLAAVANFVLTALNETYGTSYEPYDITTIENVAGFERAPAAGKPMKSWSGSAPLTAFSPEGREGLRGVTRLLNARYE